MSAYCLINLGQNIAHAMSALYFASVLKNASKKTLQI